MFARARVCERERVYPVVINEVTNEVGDNCRNCEPNLPQHTASIAEEEEEEGGEGEEAAREREEIDSRDRTGKISHSDSEHTFMHPV